MTATSTPEGLCATCAHRKKVGNRRGSRFTLCLRSREDSRFPRYPPLPVLRCRGYERGEDDPWKAYEVYEEGEHDE